jgi:hypothetical protein
MAILSFPKMLSFSTAEYSKQSSNGNNPIEARERHLHDDNEQRAREEILGLPSGRMNTFKQSQGVPMTPKRIEFFKSGNWGGGVE